MPQKSHPEVPCIVDQEPVCVCVCVRMCACFGSQQIAGRCVWKCAKAAESHNCRINEQDDARLCVFVHMYVSYGRPSGKQERRKKSTQAAISRADTLPLIHTHIHAWPNKHTYMHAPTTCPQLSLSPSPCLSLAHVLLLTSCQWCRQRHPLVSGRLEIKDPCMTWR